MDSDPEVRRAGRERFRFYRDRGYPLENHEISQ
jgi:DNA polymerase-3 subunit chi